MPEQPSHRLPEEFGGNEWLVDELYEQYQKDKNAVDAKWWPLFESFGSAGSSSSNGNSGHAAAHPATREMPVTVLVLRFNRVISPAEKSYSSTELPRSTLYQSSDIWTSH